jgi:hypothetical protein
MVLQDGQNRCLLHLSRYILIWLTKNATNVFVVFPLALDPNVKLAYAEDKWDAEAMQDGIARLEAVVHMLSYNGCNRTANLRHTV